MDVISYSGLFMDIGFGYDWGHIPTGYFVFFG